MLFSIHQLALIRCLVTPIKQLPLHGLKEAAHDQYMKCCRDYLTPLSLGRRLCGLSRLLRRLTTPLSLCRIDPSTAYIYLAILPPSQSVCGSVPRWLPELASSSGSLPPGGLGSSLLTQPFLCDVWWSSMGLLCELSLECGLGDRPVGPGS